MPVEVRYYPICPVHGERSVAVDPRKLEVRCGACGRLLDATQPRLVTLDAPAPAA